MCVQHTSRDDALRGKKKAKWETCILYNGSGDERVTSSPSGHISGSMVAETLYRFFPLHVLYVQ